MSPSERLLLNLIQDANYLLGQTHDALIRLDLEEAQRLLCSAIEKLGGALDGE